MCVELGGVPVQARRAHPEVLPGVVQHQLSVVGHQQVWGYRSLHGVRSGPDTDSVVPQRYRAE